jgi:hypothetical protein
LNVRRLAATGDPEIQTRISQYEMAYRMQTSAPDLIDLSGESRATLDLYGAEPGKPSFAANCLLPAGWSSGACGSCSSTTRTGTATAARARRSRRTSTRSAATSTRGAPRS